jgi:hypothetical protein
MDDPENIKRSIGEQYMLDQARIKQEKQEAQRQLDMFNNTGPNTMNALHNLVGMVYSGTGTSSSASTYFGPGAQNQASPQSLQNLQNLQNTYQRHDPTLEWMFDITMARADMEIKRLVDEAVKKAIEDYEARKALEG